VSAAVYYHGGKPGLKRGMFVLPPTITGARSASDYGAAHVHRRDRVYIATSPEAAAIWAALHPSDHGTVYQVEPDGALEPDPDWDGDDGVSWQCERARVVKVHRLERAAIQRIRRIVMPKIVSQAHAFPQFHVAIERFSKFVPVAVEA
jgi:hypothetical protein